MPMQHIINKGKIGIREIIQVNTIDFGTKINFAHRSMLNEFESTRRSVRRGEEVPSR